MDFAGHSLVMYGQSEGGASRVAVDFDETYQGCTVSVTVGKQVGRTSFSQTSLMGERLEVLSVQTAGFECSIKEDNVFAQRGLEVIAPTPTLAQWPYRMVRLACDLCPSPVTRQPGERQ
jgi:hypothetical protein